MTEQPLTSELAKALEHSGMFVESIDVSKWGTEIIVCGYHNITSDPTERQKFKLVFRRCNRILLDTGWEENFEDDSYTLSDFADVIGFDFYPDKHQAVIHTDLFEIIVDCGELILDKNW